MNQPPKSLESFQSLVEIMRILRSKTGCPWDKEQTPDTLSQYAIEETFELVDAIESGVTKDYVEELGDVLMQVVFHAQIGKEQTNKENKFTIEDVIKGICTKLVTRHPHVFGDVKVKDSEEVLKNWVAIKKTEKGNKVETSFSVPKYLPALQKAAKIGGKTKKEGFDWKKISQVVAKLDEEVDEFKKAKSKAEKEHELGDILFTVAQIARHLDIDPEQALRKTNNRFEKRFFKMKDLAKKKKLKFETLPASKIEDLWEEAKSLLP